MSWQYKVVSHDLGRDPKKWHIESAGVRGTPDALFKHWIWPKWVVGEAKSRASHDGILKLREKYQLTLYMGIIKRKKPLSSVSGKLLFSNRVVVQEYDKKTFKWLLSLKRPALKLLNSL